MSIENIKPLMTFVLLSYNQEHFIREAIAGALSQTYSPLEIIFSDDCSIDSSFDIFRETAAGYKGHHKIILNRNDQNMGMGGHLNNVMELANGEVIVVAAGDDISLPNRVSRIQEVYEQSNRRAKSIFSNNIEIDEFGRVLDVPVWVPEKDKNYHPNELVNADTILSGCSHAWSREVFDMFGPLLTPVICEDMVIPFRSSLLGEIIYIDERLVKHRRHSNNIWNYSRGESFYRDLEHERFWTFEKKNIIQNWISDIEKMKNILPGRIREWEDLEKTARTRHYLNEKEISLYTMGLINKIYTIIGIALKERNLKSLRHRIGFYLLPGIYRKYMMIKFRKIKT
jgi:glycosyltransferase involved in cell wall biosynthesis